MQIQTASNLLQLVLYDNTSFSLRVARSSSRESYTLSHTIKIVLILQKTQKPGNSAQPYQSGLPLCWLKMTKSFAILKNIGRDGRPWHWQGHTFHTQIYANENIVLPVIPVQLLRVWFAKKKNESANFTWRLCTRAWEWCRVGAECEAEQWDFSWRLENGALFIFLNLCKSARAFCATKKWGRLLLCPCTLMT